MIAYTDGDNYVKFDAISDEGNTRINRIELRSEVGDAVAARRSRSRRARRHDRHLAAADQGGRRRTRASTRSTARPGPRSRSR